MKPLRYAGRARGRVLLGGIVLEDLPLQRRRRRDVLHERLDAADLGIVLRA